jgi:thiol-disulfide isomerase/thioredoxin
MKVLYFLLVPLFFVSLNFSTETTTVQKITAEQLLDKTLRSQSDTLFVVNFWATWCRPCIEELPYFEEAKKTFSDKKVKILLVNLDFLSEAAKVENFVKKKNLQNKVYQLNDSKPNKWINQIDSTWDGAIPVTIYYQSGNKVLFHGRALTQDELNQQITTILNRTK